MSFKEFKLSFGDISFIERKSADNDFGNNAFKERGLLLYTFAKISKAKVVIETGTANGFSAVCLAKAIRDNGFLDGELHTFDSYAWGEEFSSPNNAKKSVELNGVEDIVKCHVGKSIDILQDILKSLNAKVDFAYIDSEHDYETPKKEFEIIEPYLNDGAYIFFHDTDIESVGRAVSDLIACRTGLYDRISVPLHSEMTILRKL